MPFACSGSYKPQSAPCRQAQTQLWSQVPDNALVERVSGRRLDPETGEIYHLTNKPPPPEIMHRLTQRSDDTEDKLRTRLETHHNNVKSVVSYYSDMVAEVGPLVFTSASQPTWFLVSEMCATMCMPAVVWLRRGAEAAISEAWSHTTPAWRLKWACSKTCISASGSSYTPHQMYQQGCGAVAPLDAWRGCNEAGLLISSLSMLLTVSVSWS